MKSSGVDVLFGCRYSLWVAMNCLGIVQCLGVDALFGCFCNVWVLMQFLVFDAMFGGYSMFDAMYGCLCIIGCLCNVLV